MAGMRSFMVTLVFFLAVMGPTLSSAHNCYFYCFKHCRKHHALWFCSIDCINYCLNLPPNASASALSEGDGTKVGDHVGGRKVAAPIPRT
ncbi:hypothetical protein QJS10_CPA10g00240 [Acorus calamus]|uniref:Uncharacterized protein n=1 Tax=Acorus calamus TaxID=4465 RepID=A0AAV9DZS5_ACOCL|nr:hypothetical protein QJS10_CPA10g00240 [Acorus calamus]